MIKMIVTIIKRGAYVAYIAYIANHTTILGGGGDGMLKRQEYNERGSKEGQKEGREEHYNKYHMHSHTQFL